MTIDLIPETLVFDKTKITDNADGLDTPKEQLVFVITKAIIDFLPLRAEIADAVQIGHLCLSSAQAGTSALLTTGSWARLESAHPI